MWTAKEFAGVLERHPQGGTLWTKLHRTVRYIRLIHLDHQTTVAVMTEHTHWRSLQEVKVQLFVSTPAGQQVAEFESPSNTPEFLRSMMKNKILDTIYYRYRLQVEQFLSSPDDTALPTW